MGNAAKARECLLAASRIVAEVDTVRRSELYERQHDLGRCDLVEDKPNEAEQCFKECINWAKISGYRILLVPCMRGLAAAALKCEQLERSASLYGAADLLSILQGYTTLEPWWEVMHQRYFASLGEQIDPQAFERAWQEGRNMSLEEALAYALET